MQESPSHEHATGAARSAVLVVAPQPFFLDRGTPIAVLHVVRSLSALGYDVDVLTFPLGRSPEIDNVRYIRIPNVLGFHEVPIGFSLRKVWLDLFLWFGIRRALASRAYAGVHAVEEGAFLAVLAARGRGVPVVYDMQSSLSEQLHDHPLFRARPLRRMVVACERWLLRNADRVACSAGLEARVRRMAPRASVRRWTYPGTFRESGPTARAALRAELGIGPEQPVVVYAGNFASYQGLGDLVDAIPAVRSTHPDAVFLLVGAGVDDPDDVTRRLADNVPADAYRLVPRQPSTRMPLYLSAGDVAVSPRRWGSNLPLKVLEYLAAGCAIVATNIPAHAEVLHDGLAVLVEPGARGLAQGIASLLGDPERRRRLAGRAGAYAAEHLHEDAFLLAVAGIYRDLAAAREGR